MSNKHTATSLDYYLKWHMQTRRLKNVDCGMVWYGTVWFSISIAKFSPEDISIADYKPERMSDFSPYIKITTINR